MDWNWIDLAIVSVILLSMLTGLFRGFVKEIIALITWALAIGLGFHYTQLLDPWLSSYLHDQKIRTVAAFLIILFATLLAGAIVNAVLSFILKRAGLNGTDRMLGMGFGFVRGVFIVALVLLGIKLSSLPYQQYSQESRLYAKFDPLVDLIYGYMPEIVKQIKSMDKDASSNTELSQQTYIKQLTDIIYTS